MEQFFFRTGCSIFTHQQRLTLHGQTNVILARINVIQKYSLAPYAVLHSNFVDEYNNVDYFKYGVYVIKKSQIVLVA